VSGYTIPYIRIRERGWKRVLRVGKRVLRVGKRVLRVGKRVLRVGKRVLIYTGKMRGGTVAIWQLPGNYYLCDSKSNDRMKSTNF